jgi:hypothetical protein
VVDDLMLMMGCLISGGKNYEFFLVVVVLGAIGVDDIVVGLVNKVVVYDVCCYS